MKYTTMLYDVTEDNKVYRVSYKGTNLKVDIYPLENRYTNGKKKHYGINWSGNGTVSIEEAKAYVALINEAIAVAERQSTW